MSPRFPLLGAAAALAAAAWPGASFAQADATAGAFTVERPTLVSLGFEWRIAGDENRNAAVEVSYRKQGDEEWHRALPMFRLQNEPVTGGRPRNATSTFYSYTADNMFAGSILNLDPGTAYECRFALSDPDGASGETARTVTVRTRDVPRAAPGGHVYHVYPVGYEGTKQQPAFTGLLAAYYTGVDQSDHSNAFPPRVEPGDVILVHAGVYKDSRFNYGGFDPAVPSYGTPFDGTYYLTQSGTPEKPIVIKAAGDGEVVFDGDGNHNLFNLMAASYTTFEGITVRNTDVAFLLGMKNIAGASGFALIGSRVENVGRGVQDDWAGSKDFYIADNVFVGRHDPSKLLGWWPVNVWSKFPGFPQLITSEYAVKVYGQGHVVAYNRVANWHDGIDIATYGTPSEDLDLVPVSIDFYGNDFTNIDDNCIEADGGAHNIRVFENRCFNSGAGSFSAQPTFGGPAYFFRNIAYNGTAGGPLKLFDGGSGILVYQNTFFGQGTLLGPVSNVHFRNNLFLGDGWADPVFNPRTYTNYSTSDYNGFRPNPGAADAFEWGSPDFEKKADYSHDLEVRKFASLDEYRSATGQERHSILVDYDVFEKVAMPDKTDPQRLYDPKDFDFRLKPGSAAIDKGELLPNIDDDVTGRAPDLGALEAGLPVPHYGPRAEAASR
ncbi:MAG TPA: hypothetical protein VFV10_20860 [Gammaproteobacteria bacterium]|nr:hypothetical protein [Gammaproteobacteria bacterium]